MRKRIYLLILLVFLLCGCNAEVNITIDKDKISEEVDIWAYQDNYYTKEQLPEAFRKYIPAFATVPLADPEPDEKKKEVLYYERKEKDLGTGYQFIYSYDFKLKNYKDARSLKNGFKSSSILEDTVAHTITMSTDTSGLLYFNQYPNLEEVKIHIQTTYKILEHNADSVQNNIYTWILTRDNKKNIYLLLDKTNGGNVLSEDKDSQDKIHNSVQDTEEDKNQTVKDREYGTKMEEEMNKHPIFVIIVSFLGFIILVFFISKIYKSKYR